MNFQPDDVIGKLQEVIPPGFLTSRDAFINSIPKDAEFKPYGKLVHSFTVHKGTFTYSCRGFFFRVKTYSIPPFHRSNSIYVT